MGLTSWTSSKVMYVTNGPTCGVGEYENAIQHYASFSVMDGHSFSMKTDRQLLGGSYACVLSTSCNASTEMRINHLGFLHFFNSK